MAKTNSITQYFAENLAEILSVKIAGVYPEFPSSDYIGVIKNKCIGLSYTQRVELHADELRNALPANFKDAVEILVSVLGPENTEETGMFKYFYWILPIGKFVEKYGLADFDISIKAIEEITKRNTGEYAIRPYIRKYPERTLEILHAWALSENFHLRRLASEGLRPKLPWASKLDTYVENPEPVFAILEILKEDERKFVQKSVANHLTDYIKVNPEPTWTLINRWKKSANKNTQWIIRRATRKFV